MQRYRYPTLLVVLALAACSSVPTRGPSRPAPGVAAPSTGGYYLDDGPGANPPPNLAAIPDAVPRLEPLRAASNRPYVVLGHEYVPYTTLKPYHEVGIASWYGRRYNGQHTSTGEIYDMYAMTAAHPTLPLPSYARVTNVATGKSVVVRVNDRGPFLRGRIIDLSYAAAYRLGIAQNGSGEVAVDAILPGRGAASAQASAAPPLAPASAAIPSPATSAAVVTTPLAPAPAVTTSLAPAAALAPAAEMAPAAPMASPAATAATAAIAPTPAPDVDTPPVAVTPAGYAVQLGAFANYSNARAFLARVQNQLAQAEVEAKIRQAKGLYRVYVGPYPARDDARRMGERISQVFGFPTTVAPN
jgi:rare lipoprotein A